MPSDGSSQELQRIELFEQDNLLNLTTRHSRTNEGAKKRGFNKNFNPDIKYSEVLIMYRNYSRSLQCSRSNPDRVHECWKNIEGQLNISRKVKTNSNFRKCRSREWKTVRIFVSSTFTDFYNEREILVKKVFPSLKEWCETRKLHVIECDLRWGVPKDSTTGATIATCMGELERCLEETEGEPFFINLLGERYGWIPNDSDIPEDIKTHYGWIQDISITHMEIQYGAYRNQNPCACFFLRDPSFLTDVSPDDVARFEDQDSNAKDHLKMLKDKLRSRFSNQVYDYTCRVTGLDTSSGRQQVKLEGLDDFADKVLSFFKCAVERTYPQANQSELAIDFLDENMHDQIMESKSSMVFGRNREIEIIKRYCEGITEQSLQEINPESAADVKETEKYSQELEKFGVGEEDYSILAVVAEPGMGKSGLLAKLASVLTQERAELLYHCVGISASSFHPKTVLIRIICKLSDEISDKLINDMTAQSYEELLTRLKTCIARIRNTSRKITFIIDGINELSNNDLSWLPTKTPENVQFIISCSTDNAKALRGIRLKRPCCLYLKPLGDDSQKQLVHSFFSAYNKQLDSEQIEMLTSHQGASTPLWLSMACEELRVFGEFKVLTKKIQTLPTKLDGLFQNILQRLIQEDETCCVEKALCLIRCSQGGLPESMILGLLGDVSTGEPLSLMTWATVRRYIKPFIRTVTLWHSGESRIQFFHSSMLKAVENQLFVDSSDSEKWHRKLVIFYRDICKDAHHTSVELPYHLKKINDRKGLIDFLRNDYRSINLPNYMRAEYAQSLRCQQPITNLPQVRNVFYMCTSCGMKSDLSRSGGQNKEKCIVCGHWTPHSIFVDKIPKFCMQHKLFSPPEVETCGLCKRQIYQHNGPAIEARFCSICATWSGSNFKCCLLV